MLLRLSLLVLEASIFSMTAGAQDLKDLKKVHIIVENLPKDAAEMGIAEEGLLSQTLVALKRDIPKLLINSDSRSMVYIRVGGFADGSSCVATVEVSLAGCRTLGFWFIEGAGLEHTSSYTAAHETPANCPWIWRRRVEVESTTRSAKERVAGFEGREGHRTPFAPM
jgi:hypothetical protein